MKSSLAFIAGNPADSSSSRAFDPRTKIVGLAIVLLGIVLTDTWSGLSVIVTGSFTALIHYSDLKQLLRDGWSFRLFYIFTFLMHLIFDHSGTTVFSILNWDLTTGGILAGAFFSIKIAMMVLLGGLFSRSTHPADLSRGMEQLFPSSGLIGRISGRPGIVVGLALRMLPTIMAESERIRTAQIARGLKVTRNGFLADIRGYMPLMGPLLNATMRKADSIHAAMVCRGYNLDKPRKSLFQLKMAYFDWLAITGIFVLSVLGIIL